MSKVTRIVELGGEEILAILREHAEAQALAGSDDAATFEVVGYAQCHGSRVGISPSTLWCRITFSEPRKKAATKQLKRKRGW